MYAYNPNFVLNPRYSVSTYSLEARMLALGGVSCGWVNETSNSTFSVSIASLSAPSLASLARAAAISGFDVPGFPSSNGEAYFTDNGRDRQVQAFTGAYWVVIESEDFVEPADATQLTQLALARLG